MLELALEESGRLLTGANFDLARPRALPQRRPVDPASAATTIQPARFGSDLGNDMADILLAGTRSRKALLGGELARQTIERTVPGG